MKRKNDDSSMILAKRQKTGDTSKALAPLNPKTDIIPAGVKRTSSLQAPIMLLEGHQGEVFQMKFHPEGNTFASASFDKEILLWRVYGDCENYGVIKGHKAAVIDLDWSADGTQICSASADKTVGIWDVDNGKRIRKFNHESFVNSCAYTTKGPTSIISGSDDCTAKLWDSRQRQCVKSLQHIYQVTSTCFSEHGDQVFTGNIDNKIRVWDLKKGQILYTLGAHTDTITGLSLSPDGSYLLSNSMDQTLRIFDVRPFVEGSRCIKTFGGHCHNFEKQLLRCSWSPDGSMISAGSADRFVYIWDTTSRQIVYKLPGHKGSVNAVEFHPKEDVIGSCSSDKNIYLGELGGA